MILSRYELSVFWWYKINTTQTCRWSRGSFVGIAMGYDLDGLAIKD
jgi:hypothetical protein